jgi:hypothetical protein
MREYILYLLARAFHPLTDGARYARNQYSIDSSKRNDRKDATTLVFKFNPNLTVNEKLKITNAYYTKASTVAVFCELADVDNDYCFNLS